MIRIVIADDHKVFSEALRKVLTINTAFQVIAVCNDSNSAIETVRKEKPDIVFVDTNIKPVPAVATTELITKAGLSKVIGLSMHANPCYALKMFGVGAAGYVTKNSPEAEIFEAVRQVANGQQFICNETAGMMQAAGITAELLAERANKPAVNSKSRQWLKNKTFTLLGIIKKYQSWHLRRLDV